MLILTLIVSVLLSLTKNPTFLTVFLHESHPQSVCDNKSNVFDLIYLLDVLVIYVFRQISLHMIPLLLMTMNLVLGTFSLSLLVFRHRSSLTIAVISSMSFPL